MDGAHAEARNGRRTGLARLVMSWPRFMSASVRDFGLLGTLDQLPMHLLSPLTAGRRRRRKLVELSRDGFDEAHGTDTAGILTGRELGATVTLRGHIVTRYETTSAAAITRLLDGLDIDYAEFTFVDLGCGKGKPLLIAAMYPFRRLIGLDISASCVAIAGHNLARYGPETIDPSRVELLTMDVEDFVFPPEPLVVYVYNAFPLRLLERVVAHLEASLEQAPREVVVIYVNPQAMAAFARSPRFVRVSTAADRMPALNVGLAGHELAVVFAARTVAAEAPAPGWQVSRRDAAHTP